MGGGYVGIDKTPSLRTIPYGKTHSQNTDSNQKIGYKSPEKFILTVKPLALSGPYQRQGIVVSGKFNCHGLSSMRQVIEPAAVLMVISPLP